MKIGGKAWKNFMAKLYGLGAAVVILGAMFKIMHWPGAGPMLVVGLTTEAIIFAFSAFEPIHEDPNWELVYPELALGHGDELDQDAIVSSNKNESISDHLDKMLEEAKIDGELLGRLGDGMKSLGHNANQLSDVGNAVAATEGYTESLNKASSKVASLSDAYTEASNSIAALTEAQDGGEALGNSMKNVSNNLSALNNVYELQLKGSSAHLEATEKFQGQVTDMMKNLADSVEDTRLYKENMSMLSQNLTDLNGVYGNMLKAMTITK